MEEIKKINLDHLNKKNKFLKTTLELENITTIEWRVDLQKQEIINNDFSVFFTIKDKNVTCFIERIKDGEVHEFYITDFEKLKKISPFVRKGEIENFTFLHSNREDSRLTKTSLLYLPDTEGFRFNDTIWLNNYDSVLPDGVHTDKYYYIWACKNKHNLSLVNKKWYTPNFSEEILRYDYNTHKLNKIYISHKYGIGDIYPFEILKYYKPWQVFYYFTLDNLDEPKECLMDLYDDDNFKNLIKQYFGVQSLPKFVDPSKSNFDSYCSEENLELIKNIDKDYYYECLEDKNKIPYNYCKQRLAFNKFIDFCPK